MNAPLHLRGQTTHMRRGGIMHAFRHPLDMVMIDPETRICAWGFSRNKRNVAAVWDRDYGSRAHSGHGIEWARAVLRDHGYRLGTGARLLLLTQPRLLGLGFNPVSFWLQFEGQSLVAVICEVNNTFGDRHSYLCRLPGFAAIGPDDPISVDKVFHVSPFQDVSGAYRFRFNINTNRVAIRIAHEDGDEGVVATLTGELHPLTGPGILGMLARRPLAPVRTLLLIHWHALVLKLKGAVYRPRPKPPLEEISE